MFIKENLSKAKRAFMEKQFLPMETFIKVNSMTIILQVLVNYSFTTKTFTQANSSKIEFRVKVP